LSQNWDGEDSDDQEKDQEVKTGCKNASAVGSDKNHYFGWWRKQVPKSEISKSQVISFMMGVVHERITLTILISGPARHGALGFHCNLGQNPPCGQYDKCRIPVGCHLTQTDEDFRMH
jgi:hypothetical protein